MKRIYMQEMMQRGDLDNPTPSVTTDRNDIRQREGRKEKEKKRRVGEIDPAVGIWTLDSYTSWFVNSCSRRPVHTYLKYVWSGHFVRLVGHSPNVLEVRLDVLVLGWFINSCQTYFKYVWTIADQTYWWQLPRRRSVLQPWGMFGL